MCVAWLVVLLTTVLCRSRAEGRWPDERAAGAFLCHADFPLEAHAHLLDELSRLQIDITRTLAIGEADEPIHLFLFGQRATYDEYLRLHYPNVPSRRALYIKEKGIGMVFAADHRSPEFDVDVRHEGTHALLHADLPMVPLWLDEGLAEYFEPPHAARASGHPHLKTVKRSALLRIPPDLQKLEQLSDLRQMGSSEYRHAWAWVHFMLHGSSAAREELVQFLADIRAQTPPGQLSQRLKRKIPNLDHEFNDHFRRWKQ
jgi:hypothetical protein